MKLLMPLPVSLFPADYSQARAQFAAACKGLSSVPVLRDFAVPGVTPEGRALVTQTAWLGAEDAERVLVIISGTHGVEGFAGSAIQCDLLEQLATQPLDDSLALLFIHALTPWGFAWRRRCDEQGIDLNRNFVDFSQPLPTNEGYEALRPLLFAADEAARETGFARFIAARGQAAFEQAISGGQYTDPQGPFYGGAEPSVARDIIETLIKDYDLGARRLGVVDIHTGLGPFGYGEVICDHAPESAGLSVAQQWYGDACTAPLLGTSSSVPKQGLLDYAWHRIMDERSCYTTLEFGTYTTQELFAVLLQDHLAWQLNDAEAKAASVLAMQQHFCPPDPAWRELVLFRGRQVLGQAMCGLLA